MVLLEKLCNIIPESRKPPFYSVLTHREAFVKAI